MLWKMNVVGLALALVLTTVSCTRLATEPTAESGTVTISNTGSTSLDYALSAQAGGFCALSASSHPIPKTSISPTNLTNTPLTDLFVSSSWDEPSASSPDRNNPVGKRCRDRRIASWMELCISPSNIIWDGGVEFPPVRAWAVVYDQDNQPMNGVQVRFSSNRAIFYSDAGNQVPLDNPVIITGSGGNMAGSATVWLRVLYLWIDPWLQELTVQVNAEVVDSEDICADPVFLFISYRD